MCVSGSVKWPKMLLTYSMDDPLLELHSSNLRGSLADWKCFHKSPVNFKLHSVINAVELWRSSPIYLAKLICHFSENMRGVARFVTIWKFNKRERHSWRRVTFRNTLACNFPKINTFMGVFHVFKIVKMVPNRATHLI